MVLDSMRAHGHDPCVVLQTSPGHLQAWIRLSDSPLDPAFATAAGKYLAHTYGGDLASTDWRHLGRLAGFTNRKPERRTPAGYSPWVKLVHTRVGLAPRADALLQFVRLAPWEPLEPASRFPWQTDCRRPLPGSHRPGGGLCDLPRLYTAMAHYPAIPPAGLEHCGPVGRQVFAGASHTPCSNPGHSSTGRSFPAATVMRKTTCSGPSLAQLFHPQRALCAAIMFALPRPHPAPAIAQTPPAAGNPEPSAAAYGCRPDR